MDLGLRDRAVLVTGGSGGIGAAIARAFAREHARVALTYRSCREEAEAIARELGSGEGRALALPYSLAESGLPETGELMGAVREGLGPVDVLVAAAVRWGGRRSPGERFDAVDPGEWWPLIAGNLAPVIRLVQLAAGDMRRRGWGRIVLVSSLVAEQGRPGQEFYGAHKLALHGLARSLRWDLGPSGVLVNVVCPGLTATPRVLAGYPRDRGAAEVAATPTGRLSTPEEVASAVVFLGSAANGNICGEALTVAGGR
ncbi:SDR family NAD(P)-dependent oxidoreductase [Bailinhaonella thermotolerans]|uniref:SDR family NAD(P)-dependent oxidoreductase n=1 Tax=Bailinhaonella thermotolerans TaxID=1070861 RepID=A0A3A4AYX7_9ACTN|nr:SDR family NAD(P)-dependent oxidoreductase [Bailinhaonella thermotolerans]RJL35882.1 SDR family NAD(P)-dependent oxidoreductase [Bailinhaonella thermotolerans]